MTEENKSRHLRCRAVIELLGKPSEYVEKTIREYVKNIKENQENYVLLDAKFAEIEPHENLWGTFVEIEMIVKGMENLVNFCMEYMPASIEIIKPESMSINNIEATNFFTELQGKLHNVDMVAKTLRAENDLLKNNIRTVINNLIMVTLSRDKFKEEILAKATGIGVKELKPILEILIKERKIKKEDELYSLA